MRSHTFLSMRFMLYPSYLHTSRTVPSTKSSMGADWKENAVFDRPCHAVILHNDASGGHRMPAQTFYVSGRSKSAKTKNMGRFRGPPGKAEDMQGTI